MSTAPNFGDGSWNIVSTLDFTGDLNGDVLWQNINDQSLVLWQQDGATTTAVTTLPSLSSFEAVVAGDFNGNGVNDIVLEPPELSAESRKMLFGPAGPIAGFAGNNEWNPVASSDLTGDGKDDLVRLNSTNAMLYVAEMNGTVQVNTSFFASGYSTSDSLLAVYKGTALNSFESLWFDASASQFEISRYTGGTRSALDTFSPVTGRTFVNSADYDGDGNPDFLFRDLSGFGIGDIEIFFTTDTGLESSFKIDYDADVFTPLDVLAGGDFDGDGVAELLVDDPILGQQTILNVTPGDQFAREHFGSSQPDFIDGQQGNDSVYGFGGHDILLGGEGRDFLFAGNGDDRASGGLGDDTLRGDGGEDSLSGGSGNDDISGGLGNDTLEAGNGTDLIEGGPGDDYLVGGAFGFDHLRGGGGDDFIRGGSDRGASEGGAGDDYMIGGSSNDVMFGGTGNDFLIGGLSQDTIFGGSGDDIIVGVDRAGTSGTDDTAYGGSGSDFFYLGNDDGNYYTGSGEMYIKDFSTSITSGDWLMLNGTAANYTFFDAGSTIQVRQSSDQNIIAIIDTTASASTVAAKALYIG